MNPKTSLLERSHDKSHFSCGIIQLDNYIHHQANQDIKRKLAACFVMVDNANNHIKGYYTLSNNSIPLTDFPETLQKKFPKNYTNIPVTLLGRLAVDNTYKGAGLGKLLLIDAMYRSYQATHTIGSFALVVDPIDDTAISFYAKYGFILIPQSGKMFLPMQTIKLAFTD